MRFMRLSVCYRPLLFVLCMLCTCRLAKAGFERSCSTDRRYYRPRGICGTHLSFILSMVCSMYNKRGTLTPMPDPDQSPISQIQKRSDSLQLLQLSSTSGGIDHDKRSTLTDPGIFLPRPEALSILKREFNIRGTITCECCIHRCNIRELRQYCSVPNPDLTLKRSKPLVPDRLHDVKGHLDFVAKQDVGGRLLRRLDLDRQQPGQDP